MSVLDTSIHASPVAWFRAWALTEGGRFDDADRSLRSFVGDLHDDRLEVPLLTAGVSASAAVGNLEFLRRDVDELRPCSHMFACTGSGGTILEPVALAEAHRSFGDRTLTSEYRAVALEIAERMNA